MGRVKELLLDMEILNEMGIQITFDELVDMMMAENLSASEVVDKLKEQANG